VGWVVLARAVVSLTHIRGDKNIYTMHTSIVASSMCVCVCVEEVRERVEWVAICAAARTGHATITGEM
jgi:hypothetical protein